ncbi:PIG-L family deacetylase [uncultured Methanobacterium sp.]|uniref:PIG-L deacetylase family protein n=1 Tax=uncultured Methanobacterium sp. TaxID=176306 RepID=UPI002AA6DB70|nr:PIG-L family deacetylase [uncultured Methanobacterium sp.]
MKNWNQLSLIGIIVLLGILIILFPWAIGYIIGLLLIIYGISNLSRKHNIKIFIITLISFSCLFSYAYVSYSTSSGLTASDINITPSDRILVISPHPDDEALSSAGVINKAVQMGVPVSTVILTTGDGYKQDVIIKSMTFHPKPSTFIEYGINRHSEDVRAMNKIGLNQSNITFLGYPDGGMQYLFDTNWDENNLYYGMNGANHVPYQFAYHDNASYCGGSVDTDLESVINSFKPTIIIYPGLGDDHPDHWATHAFVEYSTTKMDYKGKELTYDIHNNYNWQFPLIYDPKKYISPPKEFSKLNANWVTYNLTSSQVAQKSACINTFSSQKILLWPLLESFIRQNEIYATYNDQNISKSNEEVNLFNGGMPTTTLQDYTWSHDLVTTGLEYDQNSTWITLETKNGIKRADSYKFHFRLFNNGNVERADITVQNGKATPEIMANNSVKITDPITTEINQNELIVKIPQNLFNHSTALMYNVDIVENGSVDRSDWVKLNIN